jgi:hypothetical protein
MPHLVTFSRRGGRKRKGREGEQEVVEVEGAILVGQGEYHKTKNNVLTETFIYIRHYYSPPNMID